LVGGKNFVGVEKKKIVKKKGILALSPERGSAGKVGE